MSTALSEALTLSVLERIQLVGEIWDTIPASAAAPPLTDAQRAELDRRLEAHRLDPSAGSSWEEVRARIVGQA